MTSSRWPCGPSPVLSPDSALLSISWIAPEAASRSPDGGHDQGTSEPRRVRHGEEPGNGPRVRGASNSPRGWSLVLQRSCRRAYARGVTRLDDPRGRAALVLVLALFGWVAVPRSSPEHPLVRSSLADAERIESVSTLPVTTSGRRVLLPHTRFGESQRALWVRRVSVAAIGAPASALRRVHFSPSILSAGPVAQGLAGRGPPSSTDT
jgi:hypothetical protein